MTSQALLPYDRRSFQGYRLLREYFAFPERFHFFGVRGLQSAFAGHTAPNASWCCCSTATSRGSRRSSTRTALSLYATPVVNLFARRADRIHLSEERFEHQLVVDRARPLDFEVFSITAVKGMGDDAGDATEFRPFYGDLVHHDGSGARRLLHHAPRAAAAVRAPAAPRRPQRLRRQRGLPLAGGSARSAVSVDHAAARGRGARHQSRPAAAAADRLAQCPDAAGRQAGVRDPGAAGAEPAAGGACRGRLRLAAGQPPLAELPVAARSRRRPAQGRGRAARVAGALCRHGRRRAAQADRGPVRRRGEAGRAATAAAPGRSPSAAAWRSRCRSTRKLSAAPAASSSVRCWRSSWPGMCRSIRSRRRCSIRRAEGR